MNIEELDNVQGTKANAFKCKAQMLRLWMQKDLVPSWEKLVTALEEINQTELADDLWSHHSNNADIVSSVYGSVESRILRNKVPQGKESDGLKHEIQNLARE